MTVPKQKPNVIHQNFKYMYGILLPSNPKKSDLARAAKLFNAIGATMCADLCKRTEKWL